ncbi:efflux RND transporter permease subunit [Leptolyngbya sp. BC1307]|uniref:efflux RND transporter permease subunit n=1 Tax=Leptolyngbya sp. BC1307 TaxID=2029589 RepID=UPI000EFADB4E|nr:efflux RND transporter permease subunit [Leptolyngbya sp. BC1307]
MAPTSFRDRFNVSRIAIQHSWVTVCCWIAIAVAGLFALSSLKYALFPDITFPVVVVSATAPIETALESETQLTIPLEDQLRSLEPLNKTVSSTSAGRTVINLRFKVGTALDEDRAAVEQALGEVELPPAASYDIIPLNLNEATAISYALSSEGLSLTDLADLAEAEILPVLQEISGVLRVDLRGTGVQAQPDELEGSLAALQNSPTLVRFDRQTALAVQVVKQGDANTLEVVDRVESAVQQLESDLPQVQFTLAASQAEYIRAATQATISSLIGAIAIAVLVIFAFLRSWRATLITALAIPLSLLGTCIVMAVAGFNLETITLLALALVIGIVVDDAIVELENIIRHIELGHSPRQAALIATREIGLTVSASTLTIAAVFLPVAFMGGTIGQFFKPFGLTVSAAVLISLLVARTLSPVLAAYWLKPGRLPPTEADQGGGQAAPVSWLERSYSRLLAWSLAHRWNVVGIAIASFIAGIAIIPLIPQGFIPQLDRGEFYLNYTVPLAQSQPRPAGGPLQDPQANPSSIDPRAQLLQQTLAAAEPLEDTVFQLSEVDSVLTTAGGQGRPNQGSLYIKLKGDRTRDTAAVQTQLRQDLPEQSDLITSIEDVQFVDTGGEKPLQVALLGDDLATLDQAAAEVKAEVEGLPGFADVSLSGEDNTPEQIVEITRQNGERVAFISANLSEGKALGDATDQVVEIAQSIIPADIRIDLGGDSARIGEVLGSFGRTLAFAVVCMLAVLLIPFGRLLEPAVVGLTLPLSVVGAMLALLVTQSDFGLVSVLGLLFLLGLLDKNALLMMDYTNQLRRTGMKRTEAILQTGLVRLRPILMTTASTVLGMIPIALGLGAGSELRQPMAVAIIGGLLTSTLLSLVVVPVLYSLLEDSWEKVARRSA